MKRFALSMLPVFLAIAALGSACVGEEEFSDSTLDIELTIQDGNAQFPTTGAGWYFDYFLTLHYADGSHSYLVAKGAVTDAQGKWRSSALDEEVIPWAFRATEPGAANCQEACLTPENEQELADYGVSHLGKLTDKFKDPFSPSTEMRDIFSEPFFRCPAYYDSACDEEETPQVKNAADVVAITGRVGSRLMLVGDAYGDIHYYWDEPVQTDWSYDAAQDRLVIKQTFEPLYIECLYSKGFHLEYVGGGGSGYVCVKD